MIDTHALPKYVQIAELLIRDIAAGRLVDGARLPPERDMAAELSISVGTLRKALADLDAKGLVERVQGSGNYIRSKPDATGIYAFFRLELVEGGGLPTAEILSVTKAEKPASAPDFGPAEHGFRIRRRRALGGIPIAVEEIWLDGSRAEAIEARDLSESLYLFYRDKLGLWISEVEDRVGVCAAPDWAPADGPLIAGETAGYVERLALDQDGARVEFSRTWYDAGRARYVARLR